MEKEKQTEMKIRKLRSKKRAIKRRRYSCKYPTTFSTMPSKRKSPPRV